MEDTWDPAQLSDAESIANMSTAIATMKVKEANRKNFLAFAETVCQFIRASDSEFFNRNRVNLKVSMHMNMTIPFTFLP
jgi:hypothetical protein